MASSGLKKMLIFIISNTEGVIVLVCPAVFWTLDGLSGRCYNEQADDLPKQDKIMTATSATKRMATTSATCKNKLAKHQPIKQAQQLPGGYNICHLTHQVSKNCRAHQHYDTFSVGNNKD